MKFDQKVLRKWNESFYSLSNLNVMYYELKVSNSCSSEATLRLNVVFRICLKSTMSLEIKINVLNTAITLFFRVVYKM